MNNEVIQIMDITSLKAVLAELRKKIIPSRFEKVQQLDPNTLQICFRSLTNLIWIEISWQAECPRIVEINQPSKLKGESTLAKQLQYGLRGMPLVKLEQKGFDRVVNFHFAERINESVERLIALELMGRHSNILLLDKNKTVITIGKQIRSHLSRLRPISTGDIYTPPPPLKGVEPNTIQSFKIWKEKLLLIPISLKESLQQNFQGISPSLAKQLASHDNSIAERLLRKQVNDLTNNEWKDLYQRWLRWLDVIQTETFYLCFNGPTQYRVWGQSKGSSSQCKDIGLNLGKYYTNLLNIRKLEQIKKQAKTKIEKMRNNESEELKAKSLLLANCSQMKSIQEKADSILCSKNPSKKKIIEAQKLYKKAKKMRRSESIINERISYHKQRLVHILEAHQFLEEIISNNFNQIEETINAIKQLADGLEQYIFQNKRKSNIKNKKPKKNINILELRSHSGLLIQIGRNHIQNEYISLEKARKGDIWFHAQECPGSHVILKASNGTFEEIDLKMGADLASFFSKGKNNKKVPVIMAPAKKLQRLKGAIAGTVNFREGRILWGNPLKGKEHYEESVLRAQNDLSSLQDYVT